MKKIKLNLTLDEVRVLYKALSRMKIRDEESIIAADKFPESEIIAESGKQASERKETIDYLIKYMLSDLTYEQWMSVVKVD